MTKLDRDTVVTITMTRQQALKQGLLTCTCGHPENNHFDHNGSCAHCSFCKKYTEVSKVGTLTIHPK